MTPSRSPTVQASCSIHRDCPRDYPRLVGARPCRRAAPRRRRAPHRVDRRLRLARAPVLGERAAARAAGRLQMPRRPRRLEITRDYPKDYPGLGSNCLVVGHANGLRALVACVQQNVDDESLPSLGLPNGLPLIYELEPDGGVCGGHCTCPGHVLDMSETCMVRQRAVPERGALLRAAVAGLLLGRRVPRLQRPRPGPVGRTQQRRAARRLPRLVRQHRRRRRRAGTTSTHRRPPPHLDHTHSGCLGRQLLGLRGHPREERLFTPHAVSRLRRRSSRRRAATSCCAMRTRTGTGHHPASMPRLGMALLRAASEPPIVRTSLVGSSTFSSTWLGGTGRSEAPPGPASRVSTNDRVGAGLHGCRLRGSPPPPATLVSDVLVQAPVAGGARRSSSRRRSRRRPRRYLLRALLRPQACSRRDFGSCSQGFSRPWPARSCPCASAARVPPDATTQLGRHGSDRAVVAMAAAAAAMVMAAG